LNHTIATPAKKELVPKENSSRPRPSEETPDHIGYLDGWRGIAISFVLVEHFTQLHVPKIGRLGVDIFFVLSGLLMSRILFIKKTPLATFYKRRITRIIPVFLLFTVFVFIAAYIKGITFSFKEVVATLLFLRTYIPLETDIWASSVPIGHLWSLNVEEHFYILLSIATLLPFSRKVKGVLFVLLAFASIFMIIYYLRHKATAPINYSLRTECSTAFLFLSSGYFLLKDNMIKYVKPWMPPLTLAIALFCYSGFAPWYASFLFAPFLLAFTVNHLEESSDMLKKALSMKPLQLMGVWSYSIYLWQQPFYSFKSKLPYGTAFAGAMIVGILSYYYYEDPARKWLNRLGA